MNWISSKYYQYFAERTIFVSTREDKKNRIIWCSSRYFLEIGRIDGKSKSNYEMSHGRIRALIPPRCHLLGAFNHPPTPPLLKSPNYSLLRPHHLRFHLNCVYFWTKYDSANWKEISGGINWGNQLKNSLTTRTGNLWCYAGCLL